MLYEHIFNLFILGYTGNMAVQLFTINCFTVIIYYIYVVMFLSVQSLFYIENEITANSVSHVK